MGKRLFIFLLCVVFLCDSKVRAAGLMGALSPLDPSSYSRPELAILKHISLSFDVDFENKVLYGDATLTFDVLANIDDLPLDISKLKIESIQNDGDPDTELQYTLGEHIPDVGSKLNILLPKQVSQGEKLKIRIKYSTDPSASALTWLDVPQTAGKKHPYVFSQSSPIHARSILPCQDTPAVKFTYDAEVTAPEEFTVLMSALRGEVKNNKSRFNQPVPLPSNLFALAVGVLDSRTVGPRSKVWSEKEDVDRIAYEFAETETYLQAAEKTCGSYDWTEYDLLVLPPSFPHGAMENPCITFVSPTIVVGDRSLSSTIIHEIMHSWTGNAVSIKNFEHFWLKEGFTVFLERKVSASFINDTAEAKRRRDFHSLLGLQQLTEGVDTLGASNPLTKLRLNLDGVHPDEAFSIIPYEKGSLFLRYLEDLFGGPGKYDTTNTVAVTTLVTEIENSDYTFSADDIKNFDVHQLIYLLQQLIEKPAMPSEKLIRLGDAYGIIGNKNNEILYRWLRLCVRSRDETRLDEVFNFLNSLGRLKYVRPLYRELYAWEDVRGRAIDNFLANEQYMSHLTAYNLRIDLHLSD